MLHTTQILAAVFALLPSPALAEGDHFTGAARDAARTELARLSEIQARYEPLILRTPGVFAFGIGLDAVSGRLVFRVNTDRAVAPPILPTLIEGVVVQRLREPRPLASHGVAYGPSCSDAPAVGPTRDVALPGDVVHRSGDGGSAFAGEVVSVGDTVVVDYDSGDVELDRQTGIRDPGGMGSSAATNGHTSWVDPSDDVAVPAMFPSRCAEAARPTLRVSANTDHPAGPDRLWDALCDDLMAALTRGRAWVSRVSAAWLVESDDPIHEPALMAWTTVVRSPRAPTELERSAR